MVTDGFTSLLKEVVLRIVIALKNPSFSARFAPVILGSNDMHDNHFTTENEQTISYPLAKPGLTSLNPSHLLNQLLH
jgi:hypothetical protein